MLYLTDDTTTGHTQVTFDVIIIIIIITRRMN